MSAGINAIVVHLEVLRQKLKGLEPDTARHMEVIGSEIQLLDRVVPGDVVADRGDVVHPAARADVLVVVVVLAELLEPGMEIAVVRHGADDALARLDQMNEPYKKEYALELFEVPQRYSRALRDVLQMSFR